MVRFEAVLARDSGSGGFMVEVPFDVREAFGAGRPPVVARVNGYEWRTTIAVYGGRAYVGINKTVRDAAGIGDGDRVTIELALDDQPRTVDTPADLVKAFADAPDSRTAFDALSFTHRKEYVRWIEDAKRDETRARRVAKTIEMLRAGTKTPD